MQPGINQMNKNSKYVTIASDSGQEGPSLIVQVKPTERKNTFNIKIVHPNTKKALYDNNHRTKDLSEAFVLGREIRNDRFSDVKTVHEEKVFIPSPKKGKMAMVIKDDQEAPARKKKKKKP